MNKYVWKNRVLLVKTSNYTNKWYKNIKQVYQDNIKEFHKRYLKLVIKRNKTYDNSIELIGFDGKIKKTYKNINVSSIISTIDAMPLGTLMKNNKKIKPVNLSLYSDYNKKTTTPGLGFKNKQKAIDTLKIIDNRDIKYKKSVVTTMIGRAKHHPHKTNDMEEAIKVFENWLKNN
tara:strand:+ start:1105 stop:1629 length:525 start_codon:yes stop_codon:yes gene_type:complete